MAKVTKDIIIIKSLAECMSFIDVDAHACHIFSYVCFVFESNEASYQKEFNNQMILSYCVGYY